MKTHTKVLVTAALAALTVGVLAAMPWKNPKVVEELGLTAQQQQQLEDLSYKQQKERVDLKYQLELKQLALRQEMDKEAPVEAAVNRAIDEASAVRAQMQKMRFRHMQAVRAILTPEQWSKMKQHQAERRGDRRERMRGMRGGRGMGPGAGTCAPGSGPGPGGPGGMAMGGPEGPEGPEGADDFPPPPPEEGDGGDLF